jgi:hypothetical protein
MALPPGGYQYARKFAQMIVDDANGTDRTLQRQIGPSGLGNPCYHCLACELMEIPQTNVKAGRENEVMANWVGSQSHTGMERILEAINTKAGRQLYIPERKVYVGDIGPLQIRGTADCYDVEEETVVDWKFPRSDFTITNARKGKIKQHYQVQPHLYGLGYENEGYPVRNVCVMFFPTTAKTPFEGIPYMVPYDRGIAERALDIARGLYALMERDGTEAAIRRFKRDPECWDCARYAY